MFQSLALFPLVLNQLLLLPVAAPHLFPDGYVDRAVVVVVRDQRVHIEYSVGMNDNTMQQVMDDWQSSGKLATDTTETAGETNTDNAMPSLALDLPPNGLKTGIKTDASDPSTTPIADGSPDNPEEEFANDHQLAADFREMAVEHFSKNLIVTCDGKPLLLTPTPAPLRLRRHMSATVEYEAVLPAESSPAQLSISDENWGKLDGAIRCSLKAAGQAVLTQSNVAPILVRAERIELGKLNQDARQQARTINAQIVQVPIE